MALDTEGAWSGRRMRRRRVLSRAHHLPVSLDQGRGLAKKPCQAGKADQISMDGN